MKQRHLQERVLSAPLMKKDYTSFITTITIYNNDLPNPVTALSAERIIQKQNSLQQIVRIAMAKDLIQRCI